MQIVLIQLNEINFDVVSKYAKKGYDLKTLYEIYSQSINTIEDEKYENLEPWIQWVTCFQGQPFKYHKTFRLGDGYKSENTNIFHDINKKLKKSCGAICPMNISSKGINFDFFIPDPWSNENPIGNISLNLISKAIKKGVNNNTNKKKDILLIIKLLTGLLFNLNLWDFKKLLKFYLNIKNFSFRKALFLDYILVVLHQRLIRKHKTDFSTIFLNAGAHIQHHYFLNSKVLKNELNPNWYIEKDKDPLLEALMLYEELISSYKDKGYKIILITGLQQIPTKKCEFYYRLNNHDYFLKYLGIKFKDVFPRMTRDFEITFNSNLDRDESSEVLSKILDSNGVKLFGEIEIREKSIFCSLTYDKEIFEDKYFFHEERKLKIYKWVNFVALKNGIHDKNGYLYINDSDLKKELGQKIALSDVRELILRESKNYYLNKKYMSS